MFKCERIKKKKTKLKILLIFCGVLLRNVKSPPLPYYIISIIILHYIAVLQWYSLNRIKLCISAGYECIIVFSPSPYWV